MNPRKLHDDLICDQCAIAAGAIEPVNAVIAIASRKCCVCESERMCTSIRDWKWTLVPHREQFPGNRSEAPERDQMRWPPRLETK
jgi:hypothetical protein